MRKTVDMFKPCKITQGKVKSLNNPNVSVTHTTWNTFIVYLHSGWGGKSPVALEFVHTWDHMIDFLKEMNNVLGIPFEKMNLHGSARHTKEAFETALTSDSRTKEETQ